MAGFIIISLVSYYLLPEKEKGLEQGILCIITIFILDLFVIVEMCDFREDILKR